MALASPRAPFRCLVRGHLCDLRIGNGSVENYVSGSLVRYLNLRVTPHPSPYNARGTVAAQITTQCCIPLCIGHEYWEEVLCDVMDELAFADIVFGCPWLNSKKVTYYVRDNQYVFTHKGVRITVAPELTNDADDEQVAVTTLIYKA